MNESNRLPLKYRLMLVYLMLPLMLYFQSRYWATALFYSPLFIPIVVLFFSGPLIATYAGWNLEKMRNPFRFVYAIIICASLINAILYIRFGPEDDFLEWNKIYHPNQAPNTESKFIGQGTTDWIEVSPRNLRKVKWQIDSGQVLATKSHKKANYSIWVEGSKIPCTGPNTFNIKRPMTFSFAWIHPDYRVSFKVQ